MNRIARFFHELRHPHCQECEDDKICQSCETLKTQLAFERDEKSKLLEIILEKNKPQIETKTVVDPKLFTPRQVPWKVQRQLLESEDREAARIARDKSKEQQEISKLEKEIGVNQDKENAS